MSYFVTITGQKVEVSDLATVELIPANGAQSYISEIAAQFAAEDASPSVFLVHDRETGTSDELVGAAIDAVFEGGDFGATDLGKVLSRLVGIARIWDAGAINPIKDEPLDVPGFDQLSDTFSKMAKKGHIKYVRSQLTSRWSGP
jgi:hypothetical protein